MIVSEFQECPEKLKSKIKCKVPKIEVPPKFEQILTTNVDVDKPPVYKVDDETLTFYAGVVFDGFDEYRFINQSSPGFTQISAASIIPTVEEFDDIVQFDSKEKEPIEIKVHILFRKACPMAT